MKFLPRIGWLVLLAGLAKGCSPDDPYNQNATFIGTADGQAFYTNLFNEGLSYDNVKEYCEYFGFKPAVIDTPEKDNVIRDYLLNLQQLPSPPEPNSHPFWLSLNDIEAEGTFKWIGSELLSNYFNWAPGSPANDNYLYNCVSAQLLAASGQEEYQYGWINLPCGTCWRPLCTHDN